MKRQLTNSATRTGCLARIGIAVLTLIAVRVGAQNTTLTATNSARITTSETGYRTGLGSYDQQLVYSNDFSRSQKIAREEDLIEQTSAGVWRRKARPDPEAEWIVEGWGGVEVRGGTLRVAPSPFDAAGRPTEVDPDKRSHMVVWNQRVFPADLRLEFDMTPSGSTNGLAIVFFSAAGKNGEDLFDLSLPPRRADYPNYHSGAIANYSDSYWSRNTEAESLSNRNAEESRISGGCIRAEPDDWVRGNHATTSKC